MSLTRATLGQLIERQSKVVEIQGHEARIQKPSPLEYAEYQTSIVDPKTGKFSVERFEPALRRMVACMWVDDDGNRLFGDDEIVAIGEMVDLHFYQQLSEQCQLYATGAKASETLGESEPTTD